MTPSGARPGGDRRRYRRSSRCRVRHGRGRADIESSSMTPPGDVAAATPSIGSPLKVEAAAKRGGVEGGAVARSVPGRIEEWDSRPRIARIGRVGRVGSSRSVVRVCTLRRVVRVCTLRRIARVVTWRRITRIARRSVARIGAGPGVGARVQPGVVGERGERIPRVVRRRDRTVRPEGERRVARVGADGIGRGVRASRVLRRKVGVRKRTRVVRLVRRARAPQRNAPREERAHSQLRPRLVRLAWRRISNS